MQQIKKVLVNVILVFLLFSFSNAALAQSSNIFKASNIKASMLKVSDWQFKHSNGKPENTWTNAAFYTGVVAAYETTKSKTLLDSLMAIGERNNWLPAKRYDHADDIAITQTYIDLYRISKNELMLKASIDSIKKLALVPGGEIKRHHTTTR